MKFDLEIAQSHYVLPVARGIVSYLETLGFQFIEASSAEVATHPGNKVVKISHLVKPSIEIANLEQLMLLLADLSEQAKETTIVITNPEGRYPPGQTVPALRIGEV